MVVVSEVVVWAVGTALVAVVLAFLLLAASHWAAGLIIGRELGVVACYVAGCSLMGLVYLGWALAQRVPIPALWGWLAWGGILAGAGLGTMLGHWLDDRAAERTRKALERGLGKRGQQEVGSAGDC